MAVVMRSGEIRRYDANERLNHWAVAILFVLLAASGLAFFHPAFWFLSVLLGGGTWARILHPFLGVLMFVLFFVDGDALLERQQDPAVRSRVGQAPIRRHQQPRRRSAADRQVQRRAKAVVLDAWSSRWS